MTDLLEIGVSVDTAPIVKLTQAFDKANASYTKLDKAFNEGKITAQQYAAGINQVDNALSNIKGRIEKSAQATETYGNLLQKSQDKAKRFGLVTQQAGYQIGDFIVQVQSGTNAFVAFGQQATQMVGFLPSVAEELGLAASAASKWMLGLSIVVPLVTAIGAAWMRTGEDTKKAVDTVANNIKSLQDTVNKAHLDNIKIGFKVDEDSVAKVREDMIKAQMAVAEDVLRINQLKGIGGRATAFVGMSQEQVDAQQAIINNGQKILDQLAAEKEARRILAGQGSAAAAVQAKLVSDKAEELRKIKEQAVAQQTAADKSTYLKNVFHAMAGETSSVSSYLLTWPKLLDSAAAAAQRINFAKLANLNSGMMGRAGGKGQGESRDYSLGAWQTTLPDVSSSGASGGGGNSAIESLIDSLKTEQEKIDEWYKISQTSLQSASDQELAIIGGRHEAELRLEEEHQKRLSEIKNVSQNTQLQDTATFFGGLAAVAQAGGDKMTKVARVFSAAQALTNSYLAFTQVLADPSLVGRPWARFGMAASALASGLQAVAAIKSGSSGSISSHGSVGTSSAAAAPAPQQVLIQGLKPTDMFSGEQLSSLFDSLYKENRNRGMVFMVQR